MNKSDYKQFMCAYRIANDDFASKKDQKKAFKIWQERESKGYIRSGFYLGVCYDFGMGTKKNRKKAFKLYKEAAENGHREEGNRTDQ